MANWSSLAPSPAVDAALRRAAAEQVMGWWQPAPDVRAWYDKKDMVIHVNAWLHNWNRDDLARVFVAAKHHVVSSVDDIDVYLNHWCVALGNPRAALCGLLDLLGIKPQEGLEA